VQRDASPLSMQQQLHSGETPLELSDARDRSDRVQGLGRDVFDVLALRHREHQPLGRGEGGLDRAQRARTAGANRRGDARKEYNLAEGKHRQGEAFSHLVSDSSRGPKRPGWHIKLRST
jgi:hypothetical protein